MTTVELQTGTAAAPALIQAPPHETALWYKDAIIYQLHVRAFRDSNNDGIGDFRGLTEKLDYVQDLGVTAIWLLPFFPSPLKDDGYDISDYTNVHPQYGMLDDFQLFLDEAHRRELRVITEMVLNHTSDQHVWFQRSRRAPPGSRWRDWYVWSDTPERYQEARIIFQDFESSNWSWDAVAGAYFWHRFYNHQPDLNFDNPEVCEAMIAALDFWLDRGVDGLRLDAVPYLYEREGTNCENLPETHAFLKQLRAHIDEKYSDRMLLAEANQWPEDAAAYFGDGDECHMNFHFPLMPRLFMAVEREDRTPIIDILEQTPILPPACQWAIFLRNHDELTLEMVTDEERDYMYRTYAVDLKARINLGIRRRLAPLLSNNRRKIELMTGLLLSLPGTPIIYYGDEISMGDNFHLGDRNGVRTPMHWNGDRNAGFSRANPQSLYLPVIIDPEYHYEFRNVEVQHGSPHSLLWWMRRILDLRKQYHTFGHGSFEVVPSSNSKVFTYLRETDEETLLIVANLSRFPQFVDLDLSRYRGRTPMEMFGRSPFPVIDDRPYRISLGPHGFYWLCLGCRDEEAAQVSPADLPTCDLRHTWEDLLKGRGRKALREALEPFLRRHRWFAGKARTLTLINVIDILDVDPSGSQEGVRLMLVNAAYTDGEPDAYMLPVMLLDEVAADELLVAHPEAGILRVELPDQQRSLLLCEATWDKDFWHELLATVAGKRKLAGRQGLLTGARTSAFPELWDESVMESIPTVHGGEQSNTSAVFDERFILKLFRRLTPGINPDFEIGRKLTEHAAFANAPKVAGALEYRDDMNRQYTVAILHQYISNVGDAWTYTLDELSRYLERVQSTTPETALLETAAAACPLPSPATTMSVTGTPVSAAPPAPPAHAELTFPRSLQEVMEVEPHQLAQDSIGAYLHSAALLGRRTAELHVTLAKLDDDAAFNTEPFTRLYQRSLYQSMRTQARTTIELLRSQYHGLDEDAREQAARVIDGERTIFARFGELLRDRIDARRTRVHGDLHLGQVLFTGKDFAIIDFEGEPERPVSERRIKACPLRDVAGMMRSFHYASHAALRGRAPTFVMENTAIPIETWITFWYSWCSASYLQAYAAEARLGRFLPADKAQLRTLLYIYLLEKALYELRYELNNRPDWVKIPLEGIVQLLH